MKTDAKRYLMLTLVIFFTLGFLWSCINQPTQDLTGDIIFSEIVSDHSLLTTYTLGGDSTQQIPLRQSFIRPLYTANSEIVVGLSPMHGHSIGYPSYVMLESGKVKKCVANLYDSIIDDPRSTNPYQVIVTGPLMIHAFDLENCTLTEELYDLQKDSNPNIRSGRLLGATMSEDGETLFFGIGNYDGRAEPASFSLIKMDISTGENKELEEGFYPSLSHDNLTLAFIKDNALVLYDLPSGTIDYIHLFESVSYTFGPSIDWSLDDKLILVQAININEDNFLQGSIFVYDLETKEFRRVNAKGIYPSWIE